MSFNLDSRHHWQRQASTVAFPGRWRVATRWLAGCPPWRIHLSEGSRILLANNSMPVTFPMSLHPPHILGLPDAEDGYWFLGPFFICHHLSYLGTWGFPFFICTISRPCASGFQQGEHHEHHDTCSTPFHTQGSWLIASGPLNPHTAILPQDCICITMNFQETCVKGHGQTSWPY